MPTESVEQDAALDLEPPGYSGAHLVLNFNRVWVRFYGYSNMYNGWGGHQTSINGFAKSGSPISSTKNEEGSTEISVYFFAKNRGEKHDEWENTIRQEWDRIPENQCLVRLNKEYGLSVQLESSTYFSLLNCCKRGNIEHLDIGIALNLWQSRKTHKLFFGPDSEYGAAGYLENIHWSLKPNHLTGTDTSQWTDKLIPNRTQCVIDEEVLGKLDSFTEILNRISILICILLIVEFIYFWWINVPVR